MNLHIRLTITLLTFAFLFTNCNLFEKKESPVTMLTQKPADIDSVEYKKVIELFNIEAVYRVPDYYGGLSPRYEMAMTSTYLTSSNDCLNKHKLNKINEMCMYCINLVVKKNGNYILIRSANDLKKHFAPIENKEEAISYVSIITGTYPMYDFDQIKGMKYLVRNFNKTYAERQGNGYVTVTFDYDLFCCPPHKYNLTRCLVDIEGNVKVLERYAIGIDMNDHNCYD